MLTTTKRKLGQRIRQARVANGFSQEDLGDALGVTRSSVSLWEKGRSFPDEAKLEVLAQVLKVPQGYLETGNGKVPVRKELPDSGYRRDMMARMQRLIDTGKFDTLIVPRAEQLISEGKLNDAVSRHIRTKEFKNSK